MAAMTESGVLSLTDQSGAYHQDQDYARTSEVVDQDGQAGSEQRHPEQEHQNSYSSISDSEQAATAEVQLPQSHPSEAHQQPEMMAGPSQEAFTQQIQESSPGNSYSGSADYSSGASHTYMAPVSSSSSSIRAARDTLNQRAQHLIEDMNLKRQQDTQLMADYKKDLQSQVDKSMESLEQHMFELYGRQSAAIQDKLQQLFATLERIDRIEEELEQFKQALGLLYQDVQPPS